MGLDVRLKQLRERKGWSQLDVAHKLDISQAAYNKWESGASKPTLNHLKDISELFEVDFFDLVKEQMNSIDLSNAKFENSPCMINPIDSVINFQSQETINKILENQNLISKLIEQQNEFIIKLLSHK